ncbi:arylamine N-acetyltransferase [Brevibacillus dissolubilis]|uniref:arylamine N-acetyltransferase n=1 Tax=Brevibacillus dissolubilis TaxID=1844116 RepID=UPI00111693CB|nr:arylamine N-acetyltransferase [Brevibacillus dissolubilis]
MSHSVKTLPAWAIRYLNRLGVSVQKPSQAYLTELISAHLNKLAFENISKLLYYRDQEQNGYLIPPIEVFTENMHRYGYGGTCYTANSHLHTLLTELGFVSQLVFLRTDHMAILVELPEWDGEKVYVDCGAAAPFLEPVRFIGGQENHTAFGIDAVKLVPDAEHAGEYLFVRYRRGEVVSPQWVFDPNQKAEMSDFAPVIEMMNQPGSPFMKILRCQLYQTNLGRCLSLVNNQLTITYADGREEKRKLASIKEMEAVMQDEFGLPDLPVREAIDVLAWLGVDIFAPTLPSPATTG